MFSSVAHNLVPGGTTGGSNVFAHDRVTGQTTLVSVNSSGDQGSHDSMQPAISADGRVVVFSSGADNLVPGDTNGTMDAFAHDRVTGQTTRVSVSSSGGQTSDNGTSIVTAISADGRVVVFFSAADNLVPGDTNNDNDVFARDRVTGQTTRVSVSSSGGEASGSSASSGISADGRVVVFQSQAENLVPDDTNGKADVFVHERSEPDEDGDGVSNPADNCPSDANPDQSDQDGDGQGDACDSDRDGDTVGNAFDNCQDASNVDQADGDLDGRGDVCDLDRDGDTVANEGDNCPDTLNVDQADQDGDTMGDVCDADLDGDTVPDESDNCPTVGNPGQSDHDADAIGDACDLDRDGDGRANGSDNCSDAANADQADWDGDGRGDACDADRSPAQQLGALSQAVEGMSIHRGTQKSLTKKLQAALEAYNSGDTGGACSKLASFIHEVRARSGKKIPTTDANVLTADAERIETAIGC